MVQMIHMEVMIVNNRVNLKVIQKINNIKINKYNHMINNFHQIIFLAFRNLKDQKNLKVKWGNK